LPKLPSGTSTSLLAALARMEPVAAPASTFSLANSDVSYFAYTLDGGEIVFDLTRATGEFRVHHVDLTTGTVSSNADSQRVSASGIVRVPVAKNRPAAVWLTR